MRRLPLLVALLATTLPGLPGLPAAAQAPEYDIPGGRFFTQTAGGRPGGYSVTDDGAPFWSTFRELGGVATLGYPISRRFLWEGQPAQAFQKGILHWRPDLQRMVLVNIFDELSKAGKDAWLQTFRLVPRPQPIPAEDRLDFPTIIQRRQALLEANRAISAKYWEANDPLLLYGLPVSPVEDYGSVAVVRLQRAVLQQWKTERPWARAGEVVVANGGDVAKEAGFFPEAVIALEPPGGARAGPLPGLTSPTPAVTPFAASGPLPTSTPRADPPNPPAQRTGDLSASPTPILIPSAPSPPPPPPGGYIIAIDPGHGGPDSGATVRFPDGFVLREKDVNLTVAKKLVPLLREAGFAVVLTRESDVAVNRERRDLNGDGVIDLKDELQARIDIANEARAHLFLSIHHNGHQRSELNGLEVYFCQNREFGAQNRRLAALVEDSLLKAIRAAGYPLASRGQRDCYDPQVEKSYFVIGPVDLGAGRPRATQMPGVIGEAMFITNPTDAARLRDDAILTAEARGYAEAVKRYFAR
jgi:N-acetylmuramoyl-L-alanine amidase